VIRVRDGDTFIAGSETIRLRGIDTPEWGQPKSRAATARLATLLGSGPVTIIPRAQDVYQRTVADVYVGGRNIADMLRQEGFEKPPTARGGPCAAADGVCLRTITRTRQR
jgi:endonuclease YncB( thermonuclease family)